MSTTNTLERLRGEIASFDSQLVEDLAQLLLFGLEIELDGRQAGHDLPDPNPLADLVEELLGLPQAKALEPAFCHRLVWHLFHEWERLQRQQRQRQLGKLPDGPRVRSLILGSAKTQAQHMLQLLTDRLTKVLEIELEKRNLGQSIHHSDYEEQRLQDLRVEATQHGLDPDFVAPLFRLILVESRRLQRQQRDAQTAPLPVM